MRELNSSFDWSSQLAAATFCPAASCTASLATTLPSARRISIWAWMPAGRSAGMRTFAAVGGPLDDFQCHGRAVDDQPNRAAVVAKRLAIDRHDAADHDRGSGRSVGPAFGRRADRWASPGRPVNCSAMRCGPMPLFCGPASGACGPIGPCGPSC